MGTENRSVVARGLGEDGLTTKCMGKFLEVMELFCIFVVVKPQNHPL